MSYVTNVQWKTTKKGEPLARVNYVYDAHYDQGRWKLDRYLRGHSQIDETWFVQVEKELDDRWQKRILNIMFREDVTPSS